jgi:cysteine desulfurase/selenocysteine lyase
VNDSVVLAGSSRVGRLDAGRMRADFPLFEQAAWRELAYLDNAATSHKPAVVIDAIADCYRRFNGPVHRGLYPLAEEASEHYERARARLARFIGAPAPSQLVFTRSATESINMVAAGWLRPRLAPGDLVWVSRMEHHANFLPWQQVCAEIGAQLRIIELDGQGCLDLEGAPELYGPRTRLIALTHVSNLLGVINPVAEVCAQARGHAIPVLLDAAQSVGHLPVDVQALDCDFLAFSAHKMCGPTGIGALYARPERLEEMAPLLLGGGMVDRVDVAGSTWSPWPDKLEAGSPNLAGAVGFAAAADYLDGIGLDAVAEHVGDLCKFAIEALARVPGLELYGPGAEGPRTGIIAFNVEGVHPHDLGQLLGERQVAIRAGHHCCQPLVQHLGVAATARASLALYNRVQDIEALVAGIAEAREVFGS